MPSLPHIVVVDDSENDRAVLKGFLDRKYLITEVDNGGDCLSLLTNSSSIPDLVILDLHMPGFSGDDLLNYLRLKPSLRNMPILFVTAISSMDRDSYLPHLSGEHFLHKPVIHSILIDKVNYLLTNNFSSNNRLSL